MNQRIRLGALASQCGYFVGDCKQHCNNGYGCNHPDATDKEDFNCTIHACCNYECPLAFLADEDEGGADAIMELYEEGDYFT